MRFLPLRTAIPIKNGVPACTVLGRRRVTSRARRQISESTPLARMSDSIMPKIMKSRLMPPLMAATPTSSVAPRNHQPSRVGGNLRGGRSHAPRPRLGFPALVLTVPR
jgi:hypothetical protein